MTRALLDTDILSEIVKAKNPIVVARARAYQAQYQRFTFSAVSVMEVIAGFSKQRNEERVRRFGDVASRSDVIPLEAIAADLAGRIYADLLNAGEDIGVADTMIAAIAIHRGLPLATGNVSDHVRVQRAGYPLVIENWRDPLS
jgi:predicted nucleic acid-binding protein